MEDIEEDKKKESQKVTELQSLINDRHGVVVTKYSDLLSPKIIDFCAKKLKMSAHDQHEAIVNLRVYVLNQKITPSILPKGFIADFVNIFNSSNTGYSNKMDMLILSNDMMRVCPDLVAEFANHLYYARVFEELISESCFGIEHCLPVLNHFLRQSTIGYTYLTTKGILKFIFEKLQVENNKSATIALYNSLQEFTRSKEMQLDEDAILHIVNICLQKIIPNKDNKETFINLETAVLVPIVQTLANLIGSRIPEHEYMNLIINSGVSSFIMSIIATENIELSQAALNLLCNATYRSDFICFQLKEVDIVNFLTIPLSNALFISRCARLSLRTIFNVLTACSNLENKRSYLLEICRNSKFIGILQFISEEGSSLEKIGVFQILAILIFFTSSEDIFKIINFFNIVDDLQVLLEMGGEGMVCSLPIMYRLVETSKLSKYNEKCLTEFKNNMLTDEMVDLLNNTAATCENEHLRSIATFLLAWIHEESKAAQSCE